MIRPAGYDRPRQEEEDASDRDLALAAITMTTPAVLAPAAHAGAVGAPTKCHRVHGHCTHSINYNSSKSNTGNRIKPGRTSFGTARRHHEDQTVRPHH